mmetsp:Transcript_28932/g.63800  ORF Transcript_28932/g.63800 Transcript_28932/m.63800 type:complete len:213 (+) Transcript_28932:880-1518(+)
MSGTPPWDPRPLGRLASQAAGTQSLGMVRLVGPPKMTRHAHGHAWGVLVACGVGVLAAEVEPAAWEVAAAWVVLAAWVVAAAWVVPAAPASAAFAAAAAAVVAAVSFAPALPALRLCCWQRQARREVLQLVQVHLAAAAWGEGRLRLRDQEAAAEGAASWAAVAGGSWVSVVAVLPAAAYRVAWQGEDPCPAAGASPAGAHREPCPEVAVHP